MSIRVELQFGWLSLLGAAAAAFYLRPSDESFRPVLAAFIKQTAGLAQQKQSSGNSIIDSIADKVVDVAANAVAEHGIRPTITDYYVCKIARITARDTTSGKEINTVWLGAFGKWLRVPFTSSKP